MQKKFIDVARVLNELPDDLPYKASVKRVLIQAPEEDVAEVKHGEWIYSKTYYEADECNCSLCGQLMTTAKGVRMSYCPNCGARMDGGEKR